MSLYIRAASGLRQSEPQTTSVVRRKEREGTEGRTQEGEAYSMASAYVPKHCKFGDARDCRYRGLWNPGDPSGRQILLLLIYLSCVEPNSSEYLFINK
ncbi:hypothetical protein XENTR_v10008990 [Xenopus tropicalis]|nr:hypothetical protein XENTR_v10008990 [Xenopus tropicalis]